MIKQHRFSSRGSTSFLSCLTWRTAVKLTVNIVILGSIILYPTAAGVFSAPTVWPAPILLNPAQNETTTVENYPPSAVPYFEWEPVADAQTYRIQIDDETSFVTPILYEQTTPNNRYIPIDNNNMQDGTLYWRVRVETPASAGVWSEIREFTKAWGASNNAPHLLTPGAGATVEFFEAPIFSWSPVIGAADYVLKIDNDADCGSPLQQNPTLATFYNLGTRLANGTYYWCVTPRDPAGRSGHTSEVRQVYVYYAQTPQLLEPANGSTPTYTPAFRWTAVKGALSYKLYYSTDSSFATNLTTVSTKQTTYTPATSVPNDQTYYWRVSAIYGSNYEGPFSEVWSFTKHWYHQPVLLTPRNNELTNVPLFTWTPVREARKYRIEGSFDPGFSTKRWSIDTANTFFWRDEWRAEEWGRTIYWRVIPYENGLDNNPGVSSINSSFVPTYSTAVPENIWPRYFYSPPFVASGNYTPPYNIPVSHDYTVDTPTFYWSRTFVPGVDPREEADHYRLEVDNSPNFDSLEWVVHTENLSATPTEGNPFTPTASTNYYWRVRPYGEGGVPLTNSQRNQHWITQIDMARQVTPTATSSPVLQFPAQGEKVFGTTPAFEWLPQQDAVRYEFMISTDPAFGSTTYVTRTTYVQHTPVVRLPIGTYFWRVRGLDSGNNTVGEWSEGRRVLLGMQTRWLGYNTYALGTLPSNYDTLMAEDANEGLGATELTTLYMAQDKDHWLIGFGVTPTLGNTVWYGLYLDGNQQEGTGASSAPPNRPALTTASHYRPEFAIYVMYDGSTLITDTVYLHQWSGSEWDANGYKNLVDPEDVIGGAIYYTQALGYVELRVPKTAIGDEGDKPFSLSVALFSATSSSATTASDTIPDNSATPSVLNEFKTIADRVTLASPTGGLPGERSPMSYSPYVYAESPNTDYVGGYKIEVARDPLFTSLLPSLPLQTSCTGCEPYPDVFQYIYTFRSIYEDNTLYWRYSIRHKFNDVYYNAPPSEPHLFTKSGPTPDNLRVEGGYSTPKFIWDAVEGAGNYQFNLATNPDFSPALSNQSVNHESYTPVDAYAPGTYYWRVRAQNSTSPATYSSDWSPVSTLNITLPQTSLVEPMMGAVVNCIPTFRWNALLIPGDGATQGWAAAKYRLQVSRNPNFPDYIDNIIVDTISWTPNKSYPDGDYYWRVAVIDGNNNQGPFSDVYTFVKQYPRVTLVAPLTGTVEIDPFPTFIWEPITTTSTARYRIEIAQNPQFSPLIDSATTNNTRFTPVKKYNAAQYYWRIAMIDKSGSYGPWTDSIVLIDPYPYNIFLPLMLRSYTK